MMRSREEGAYARAFKVAGADAGAAKSGMTELSSIRRLIRLSKNDMCPSAGCALRDHVLCRFQTSSGRGYYDLDSMPIIAVFLIIRFRRSHFIDQRWYRRSSAQGFVSPTQMIRTRRLNGSDCQSPGSWRT